MKTGLLPELPISAVLPALGHTLAGRNSARVALATELSAAVLADLIGLNISTAVAWSRQVKRDWTDLIAARSTT